MMYDYWGQGGGNDVWGFIWMLFIMVLIVVGVVVAVRYLSRDSGRRQKGSVALDLLEKRYAQGEIDKKEFEEKRQALSE